ncbi:MAG: hypothetical protein Aurels2KO_58420 [Aureliella sp.]
MSFVALTVIKRLLILQMSRLLLQFGSNPDIEDDDGNTARSVTPYCSEFLEILSEYDAGK